MTNSKMITLFTGSLAPQERKAFWYKIKGNGKKITGLLHSNHTEVSVSFYNETELEIDSLATIITDVLELPPAKRIITWEQDLKDCSIIRGTIKNVSDQTKTVNLYLLTDEK